MSQRVSLPGKPLSKVHIKHFIGVKAKEEVGKGDGGGPSLSLHSSIIIDRKPKINGLRSLRPRRQNVQHKSA